MANPVPDIIIISIVVGCFAVCYVISNILRIYLMDDDLTDMDKTLTQLIESHSSDYRWALKIIFNSLGYSTIFLPGILIYKYAEKCKYIERCANRTSIIPQLVLLCFSGARSLELPQTYNESLKQTSTTKRAMENMYELGKCFMGLMASFLVWGLLQEKIITQPYERTLANGDKVIEYFHDSQFLVFTNRTLAFIVAFATLSIKYRCSRNTTAPITSTHIWGTAPLFKYSFASFSNIMSAWFQYEALKYVNFPTQVLAKSCKIIPVMLMGKIISRTRFELYEYLTAILISLGMLAFLLGSKSDHHLMSSINSITGIMLLVMYLVFDSFTSNWQSDLFKTYKMSSIQMMCGVNLFSSLFTAISLAIQGGFMDSFIFALTHSKFILDCVILSISSAVGQLFIFHTIESFGPVVFTIIMTLRQAIAILLSCIIYKHYISGIGVVGVAIVFVALFLRVYCSHRRRMHRRTTETQAFLKSDK